MHTVLRFFKQLSICNNPYFLLIVYYLLNLFSSDFIFTEEQAIILFEEFVPVMNSHNFEEKEAEEINKNVMDRILVNFLN